MGVADESVIENMSYNWFEDVLDVLGEVVNFSAVVNYAGNAFVEKSWDMIMDSNPMLKGLIPTLADRQVAAFFDSATPTIIRSTGQGTGGRGLFHGKIEREGNEFARAEDTGEGGADI